MPTVYSAPAAGPWFLDDDEVVLDGYIYLGVLYGGPRDGPTVDGTDMGPVPKLHGYGGMVRGHDEHMIQVAGVTPSVGHDPTGYENAGDPTGVKYPKHEGSLVHGSEEHFTHGHNSHRSNP